MRETKKDALALLVRLRQDSRESRAYMPYLLSSLRPAYETPDQWDARPDVQAASRALADAGFFMADTADGEWISLDRAIATLEAFDA